MGSINAQRVAMKVSETIGKGKKVVLGDIIKENGYSEMTSLTPSRVTDTKSYKTTIALENKPMLERLEKQIQKFQTEIERRNLKGEDTRTLVGSLDIYIHNYQLLSGGATERQVFVLPSEVMEKNNIIESSDDVVQ